MTIEQQINALLKKALLTGDKVAVSTYKGLKSAILNEAINLGIKDAGLSEAQIIVVCRKELKKRREAIDIYEKSGDIERLTQEKKEEEIIQSLLPPELSLEQIEGLVDQSIAEIGDLTLQNQGLIIGKAKQLSKNQADGAVIASVVKTKLTQKEG